MNHRMQGVLLMLNCWWSPFTAHQETPVFRGTTVAFSPPPNTWPGVVPPKNRAIMSSTHLPRHVFSAWKEKVWVEEKTKNMRRAACSAGEGMKENLPKQVHLAMPVEVMSFDLDDTLWSTKGVISAANSALQSHLEENHPVLVEGVAVYNLMKEIWKEKRAEDPKLGKDPINLTELRKAGLRRACDLAGEDPRAIVEPSFKLWWQERHNVERHLFPGVLETLSALKARGVRLIAITNGNADTDHIDCLKDFFEFCVMAEQVGERKPGLGPFMEAVRRAGYASVNDVGAEWVHVGDDITSDCVGAKGMQMRTILVSPPGGASWPAAEDVGVTELVSFLPCTASCCLCVSTVLCQEILSHLRYSTFLLSCPYGYPGGSLLGVVRE
ncbi:unnamed protein product [Choristocarpus tenellus]